MPGPLGSVKKSEAMLRDADGYFLQSLADAADVGLIVLESNSVILLWNAWIEDASRIPRGRALGKPLDDVFDIATSVRLPMAIEQALTSGLSSYLSPRFNGHLFPLFRMNTAREQGEPMVQSVVVKPLENEAGDKLCLIQIFDGSQAADRERLLRRTRSELEERVASRTSELTTEISRRRDVEAELRDAMSMAETANAAKTQFLATVSHELRTPLNSIIGFSELMTLGTLGKIEPVEYQEYTNLTLNSAMHLLELVNDILDVSAIEVGGLQLVESSVDLNRLCVDCVARVQPLAEERGLLLSNGKGASLPTITGDRLRLEQVVSNLLTNAIKFTPSGGAVKLEKAVNSDGDILLAVVDSGVGLTETEIAAAFEPFRQIQRGSAGKHEGVGLGLSLSRTLTEAHDGTLTIESVKGEYTKAVMCLPASRVVAD